MIFIPLKRFDIRISIAYTVVALLWIFFSDELLKLITFGNSSLLLTLSTLKGGVFVVISAVGLFVVLNRELRKQAQIEQVLEKDIHERNATLKTLQESELRFTMMFHGSPTPMGITRLDTGKIVDVNEALLKLSGYTREELIGQTSPQMNLLTYTESRAEIMQAIIENGYLQDHKVIGHSKEGKDLNLLANVQLIKMGQESHIVSMFYDLSEHLKLEEQLQYQALLLASVSDGVLSTNTDFDIRSWNPSAEKIYGWSAEEALGKRIMDLLHTEYIDTTRAESRKVLEATGNWQGVVIQRHKDGSPVHTHATVSYVKDIAGNKLGFVTVIRNITEQKKMEFALRESEERFRVMADSTPAIIWATDANGYATFVSRGWLTFTGQTEAEAQGMGWLDALHPEDRNTSMQLVPIAIGTKMPFQFGYRLYHKGDNTYHWTIATASPRISDNGEFLGFIGSTIDVSDHKKAEQELQKAELLRKELDHQAELLQMKEDFISIVSHEFRTPLSVIISSSELMRNYYDRMPHERQMHHLEIIQAQAHFMTELMDDVLTINKARADKLEFNPVPINLVSFCQETLERIEVLNRGEHQFIFTHEGELSDVRLDVKQLQHILVNLLSNAVKYSPAGGNVRLEVKAEPGDVEFRISDEGIGIPEESLVHLFEPFYRGRNTGEIGGTGLGLAIVKAGVDRHGGTITCETALNAGTTFIVRLPRRHEMQTVKPAAAADSL